MTVLFLEVRGPADIERALGVIGKERPGVLLVIADATLANSRRRIVELALKSRLPAIGTTRQWAEAGFLMGYGANMDDLWRRAATYVDKILKGAKPGDLPIEQASKWELVINLKAARAIGVTIPPLGGVPIRVEIEKWRILPVECSTTNRPSGKTAAGGMRHGERYQEVGAVA